LDRAFEWLGDLTKSANRQAVSTAPHSKRSPKAPRSN